MFSLRAYNGFHYQIQKLVLFYTVPVFYHMNASIPDSMPRSRPISSVYCQGRLRCCTEQDTILERKFPTSSSIIAMQGFRKSVGSISTPLNIIKLLDICNFLHIFSLYYFLLNRHTTSQCTVSQN